MQILDNIQTQLDQIEKNSLEYQILNQRYKLFTSEIKLLVSIVLDENNLEALDNSNLESEYVNLINDIQFNLEFQNRKNLIQFQIDNLHMHLVNCLSNFITIRNRIIDSISNLYGYTLKLTEINQNNYLSLNYLDFYYQLSSANDSNTDFSFVNFSINQQLSVLEIKANDLNQTIDQINELVQFYKQFPKNTISVDSVNIADPNSLRSEMLKVIK